MYNVYLKEGDWCRPTYPSWKCCRMQSRSQIWHYIQRRSTKTLHQDAHTRRSREIVYKLSNVYIAKWTPRDYITTRSREDQSLLSWEKKNRVMNGEISVRNGKCGVWCENGSNCVTVTLKAWGLAALCYVMLWPSWLLHIENNLGMRASPNIDGYFEHCHLNI